MDWTEDAHSLMWSWWLYVLLSLNKKRSEIPTLSLLFNIGNPYFALLFGKKCPTFSLVFFVEAVESLRRHMASYNVSSISWLTLVHTGRICAFYKTI